MNEAKSDAFRALHTDGVFVLPLAWDVLSVRVLERAGFSALACSAELCDGDYSAFVARLTSATELPVCATVTAGSRGGPLLDAGAAGLVLVDPTAADVDEARTLGCHVTARCTTLTEGGTIAEAVGRAHSSDLLELPGLRSKDEIEQAVRLATCGIDVPVGHGGSPPSLDRLRELGVRRVSTGTSIARHALHALQNAAAELRTPGTFEYLVDALDEGALRELLES